MTARTQISTPVYTQIENNSIIKNRNVFNEFGTRYSPKAMISHHSQLLSLDAKSVECLTIKVHLANDSPKPARAPYRPATVWQAHINNKNPIQLKRNATETIDLWSHYETCKIASSFLFRM